MFPNIFRPTQFSPNAFVKNSNAKIPTPAMYDPSLNPVDDLHVPNQLPAFTLPSMMPNFGFDFRITQSKGNYWLGSGQTIKLGSSPMWEDRPSKDQIEQDKQSRRWNEENARMSKTLSVDDEFKEFMDMFEKEHSFSIEENV